MPLININEDELKKKLTPQQYQVCRMRDTEPPFSGKLLNNKEKGKYVCVVCGSTLFSSDAKFDSGSGWPSFDKPDVMANIEMRPDFSHEMSRIEVLCRHCGSHLGHVFPDDYTETKMYCCVNSASLDFKKTK